MPAVVGRKGGRRSTAEQLRLIEVYAGNPLALKIVAQTIVDLFDGQIALFIEQGEVVFGGVRALLDEQYARLSATEQDLLEWLAILREPVSLQELQAALVAPLSRVQGWKPSTAYIAAAWSSAGSARAVLPCSRWCWST